MSAAASAATLDRGACFVLFSRWPALQGSNARDAARARPRHRILAIERLESRTLLTVGASDAGILLLGSSTALDLRGGGTVSVDGGSLALNSGSRRAGI